MKQVRIEVILNDRTFLTLPEHHEPSHEWVEAEVKKVVNNLSPCRAIIVDYEWHIEDID